ncbi:diguanylate cyclase [Pseudoduganella violaceinigra]|uniref:diguanylate cyclase n=1 Tax=Pseudoduganella violaceinigra TaxID=246602 RepID=UPI00040A1DC0|nr:diguanylate cyclase [Pseudoduganella violaceinigra]
MPDVLTLNLESEPSLTNFKVRVLLVDDQLIIVEAVRRMLADQDDIEFHFTTDAREAIACAHALQPTVILQDLVMPDVDGFELIRRFRADELLAHVPIIVLSAREDPKLKAHGFAVGANDYLVKLPDKLELLARVRHHSNAHIHRLQRDQAFRFLRESQQKLAAANVELQKLAALDPLTGIANRRRFDETLELEWQRGQREKTPLSLLMVDVDHFKHYNDSYGHPAGDLALKKVAAVLTENLKRPADLVTRYGGEEFALILPETDNAGAVSVAQACQRQLEKLEIENARAKPYGVLTMSVGVCTVVPQRQSSWGELVAEADRALYAAKAEGRNRIVNATL